jgi:serine/threonine-protein kinase
MHPPTSHPDDGERLRRLLEQWQERFDNGEDPPPEVLAGSDPSLSGSLAALIARKKRLLDLLGRWEEARNQGQELSAQDLCPDDPALASELDREIRGQLRMLAPLCSPDLPSAFAGQRYADLRFLCRGGMGSIFLAADLEIDRSVALKRMNEYSAELHERFDREARITGQLEHPGIAPVYGMGLDNLGLPYYAMRFVGGVTLSEAVGEAWGLRELLGRLITVCRVVAFAHARGVIHRDLKPSNVRLGEYGETIVLDWGLARRLDESAETPLSGRNGPVGSGHTAQGQALGTPGFMSPEQARGERQTVGVAGDIFGLGAMLYFLLTGRQPFLGTVEQMLADARECRFPRPREVVGHIPLSLEAICRKAMAKEPADRYASATDLAEEMQRWLDDEPVQAYRESILARSARWSRRHPRLVAGVVGAVVLGLIAALVIVIVLWERNRRIEQERAQADENLKLAKQAVDRSFTRLAESPEFRERSLGPARRQLLAEVIPFYERFVQQRGDLDLQAERGLAYARLGFARMELGELKQSALDYEQARDIFDHLKSVVPSERDYRFQLARVENQRAWVLFQLSRGKDAEDALRASLQLRQQLVKEDPESLVYQRGLAESLDNLGNLLLETGRPDQVEPLQQQAVAVRRQVAEQLPNDEAVARELGDAWNNQGELYRRLGRWSAAESSHREGLRVRARLAVGARASRESRSRLAVSRTNLGILLAQTDHGAEAVAELRQALESREQLVRESPEILDLRQDLADVRHNLGDVLSDLGHWEEAEPPLRAALELRTVLIKEMEADQAGSSAEQALRKLLTRDLLARVWGHTGRLPAAEVELKATAAEWEKLKGAAPVVVLFHAGNERIMGELLAANRRPNDALVWFDQARERLGDPGVKDLADARQLLAESCANRAETLAALGQWDKAKTAWKQATATADEVMRPGLRLRRARWLVPAGEVKEAVAETDTLVKAAPAHGPTCYRAARVLALAAGRTGEEALARRAVELLEQAHRAGHFRLPGERRRLETEEDFRELRKREDFRELLGRVGQP